MLLTNVGGLISTSSEEINIGRLIQSSSDNSDVGTVIPSTSEDSDIGRSMPSFFKENEVARLVSTEKTSPTLWDLHQSNAETIRCNHKNVDVLNFFR